MVTLQQTLIRLLLPAAIAATFALPASSQDLEAKLLAPDADAFDLFGASVAMDTDCVSVGVPWDDNTAGDTAGSVRIYSRDGGWHQTQVLLGSDTQSGDLFGSGLAINRGRLVVGASFGTVSGEHRGAAYVFAWNGSSWNEETKLWATDVNHGTGFGDSVCIEGEVIVCGAPSDDQTGSPAGAVYVYRRSGGVWTLEAKLRPADIVPGEEFGEAVALQGDLLAIGARRDDDLGVDSGSVYLYRHLSSGWTQEAKLHASNGSANDWFGEEVAVWADVVCVGAPYQGLNDNGAAYAFRRSGSTWSQEAQFHEQPISPNANFGSAVAVRSDYILIGGPGQLTGIHVGGNAVGFRHGANGWNEETRFTAADAADGDDFGAALSLGDEELIVGAPRKNLSGMPNVGAAYVHTVRGPTTYCWAKTNSQGCVPEFAATGSATLGGADDFHLVATAVLNNSSGLLVWSHGHDTTPFGGGALCVGPDLHSTWVEDSGGIQSGLDCTGSYDYHLTHSWMTAQGWLPGMRVYAQVLSRDLGFPYYLNLGLTAGLRITVCP